MTLLASKRVIVTTYAVPTTLVSVTFDPYLQGTSSKALLARKAAGAFSLPEHYDKTEEY